MSFTQDIANPDRPPSRLPRTRQPDPVQYAPIPDESKGFRRWVAISFLVCVLAPSVVLFLYLALIASPQYESVATFVLRGDVQKPGAGPAGSLGASGAIGALNRTQEGSMLVDFVPSRAFVERLKSRIDLSTLYASTDIDWFSRLAADSPVDDVAQYWHTMADAAVDPISGIVTLKTRAFSPEDALAISQATLEESEILINGMLVSSRMDALRIAEQDRQRALEALEAVRREVETFRRETGVVNPTEAGGQALELIFQRRTERVALSGELQAILATVSSSAPQVKALRARLAALDAQIAQLEADLLKGRESGDLATLISKYDELELKRAFAEDTFAHSELTLLRTKAEIDRWHVYLTPVTGPDLATTSVQPKPISTGGKFFVAIFVLWSIVAMIAAGTADRRG